MKKRMIFVLIVIGLTSVLFTGCGNKENTDNSNNKLIKKYNKIEIGMEQSEVEGILTGSDGKYEDDMVTITYDADKLVSSISIQLSYNSEEIKNSKVTLSKVDSFINKLNKGEKIGYNDLVSSFNADGLCTYRVESGCSRYQWADNSGNYVTASLNVYSDGYVTTIFGKY